MESVQKVFLSLSERKPVLMRIPMPISGDGTQERGISLEIIGLITDGLLLIQSFGSGSSVVISIWSVFFQSRASSIFTNMSIKAMIVLLWSLEDVWMRSNLDSCYVSAHEALWRLFQYPMHEESPSIYRLQV